MSLSAITSKLLSVGSGSPDVSPDAFEASVRSIVRERMHYPVLAGAGVITAGTALAESPLGAVRNKSRLTTAHITLSAAVTANATNFLTLIVRKRTIALPGTQVSLISLPLDTPTTDDILAWGRYDLLTAPGATLGAATAFDFADGDTLTLEVTKTGGTGLSLPIGDLFFGFEPRD